jgi:hypothetical protein
MRSLVQVQLGPPCSSDQRKRSEASSSSNDWLPGSRLGMRCRRLLADVGGRALTMRLARSRAFAVPIVGSHSGLGTHTGALALVSKPWRRNAPLPVRHHADTDSVNLQGVPRQGGLRDGEVVADHDCSPVKPARGFGRAVTRSCCALVEPVAVSHVGVSIPKLHPTRLPARSG